MAFYAFFTLSVLDNNQMFDQKSTNISDVVVSSNQNTIDDFRRNGFSVEYKKNLTIHILFILATMLNLFKEAFELISSPSKKHYFQQIENIGQWVLIILTCLSAMLLVIILAETKQSEYALPERVIMALYTVHLVIIYLTDLNNNYIIIHNFCFTLALCDRSASSHSDTVYENRKVRCLH